MSFPYPGEKQYLNETTRRAAPGSFVKLPEGVTHYEMTGPASAPTIVLVHGFSVPYFIFDPTFEFLATCGFRVLRYDLFGRGFSDRPALTNNIKLFVNQLHDLLTALHIHQPVIPVGLSMGGPISAAYSVTYPESVAGNILIDPAGTHPVPLGPLGFLRLPFLGELLLGLLCGEALVKSVATDFFDKSQVEFFQLRYRTQMRLAGFRRSILSTIRSGMLGSFSEVYSKLGSLGKPILLIWGRQDTTVPFSHSSDLLEWLPHAQFHIIEHSSHIPHFENAAEVNPLIYDFIEETAGQLAVVDTNGNKKHW